MNDDSRSAESKVPAVTTGFWAIKIVATTLGEVGGNAVTLTLGLGYLAGTAIFSAALIVLLAAQVRADRFHSACIGPSSPRPRSPHHARRLLRPFAQHWLRRWIGDPAFLGGAHAAAVEARVGTVAVETVRTPRAEGFYWATIMFSHRRSAPRSATGWLTAPARLQRQRSAHPGRANRHGSAVLAHEDLPHVAVLDGLRADPAARCHAGQLL